MRNLLLGSLAALALSASAAFAGSVVKVNVPDMVCDHCSGALSNNFSKQPAVEKVEADVASRTLTLTLKDNATLDDAAITALVKDTGFTAKTISR